MTHPNIARIHDAGTTDTGQPFFVMELLDGQAITDYCEGRGLDARARLGLFLQVCEAVQHAHHKGVIHRDLKPSNVIVTDADSGPLARVIDFGIAKAVDPDADGRELTRHRGFVGTPSYMSPEQVAGETIDTRSDVYSLGALLYRLLTGTTPLDLDATSPAEAERRIREETPPTPSSRVMTASAGVGLGVVDRKVLRRELRGGLDWSLLKALAKDRERRYATPAELAEDIRCFLEHRPLRAGPPSMAYRARVFAVRHRVAVTAAALVAASLVIGLASTAWMAVQASRARDEARVEAATARQVSAFLAEVLASPDPYHGGGEVPAREVKVVDILDQAATRLDADTASRPEVRASLHHTLGTTFLNLSLLEQAEAQLEAALALRRSYLGADHPLTLAAAHDLAAAYNRQGRLHEASELLAPTLAARTRVLGPGHPDALESMNNLADLRLQDGETEAAETLFRHVLDGFEAAFGSDDRRTITAMSNLGLVLGRQGRTDEAEQLYRRALETNRRTLGDLHPHTIGALNNLGSLLYGTGRLDEAATTYEEAERLSRQVHGGTDPHTLNITANLGALQLRQGLLDEAEATMRRALEGSRDRLGDEHPRTLLAGHNLARCLTRRGELGEALGLYRELLPTAERVLPEGDRNLPLYRMGFGVVLSGLGQHDEAVGHLEQSLSACRELHGPDHVYTRRVAEALESAKEAQR
jgi:non-specific serine/threonine protein kinase/serine/threonine-protein kinase